MTSAAFPCEMDSRHCLHCWAHSPLGRPLHCCLVRPLPVPYWCKLSVHRSTHLASRRSRIVALGQQIFFSEWEAYLQVRKCATLCSKLFSFLCSEAFQKHRFRRGESSLLESGSLLLKTSLLTMTRFKSFSNNKSVIL